MTGQIMISGGTVKPDGQGGDAVLFTDGPETEAARRWKMGEFREVERLYARQWRSGVSSVDTSGRNEMARRLVPREGAFQSVSDARAFAASFVSRAGREVLTFALQFLGVPDEQVGAIDRRYAAAGRPSLKQFAPYAAFVLSVDLTFHLSVYAEGKRSNVIDLSYL